MHQLDLAHHRSNQRDLMTVTVLLIAAEKSDLHNHTADEKFGDKVQLSLYLPHKYSQQLAVYLSIRQIIDRHPRH